MSEQRNERRSSFDEFGFSENGTLYWWAGWFAELLGYRSLKTFQPALFKAMQACSTLDISVADNFIETRRQGRRDYQLTRFACYLVAMNADARKPAVARAQVYFADLVEKINLILEGSKDVDRLLVREEIREGHHHLTDAAARAGVRDFRYFMNEGYVGLYNQPIRTVKQEKGIDGDDNLYEYMGRAELAANLFRITLTEERLRRSHIESPFEAAAIHRRIGEDVRQLVRDHTGQFPEDLPLERHLKDVSEELKKAGRLLNRRDDND